MSTSRNTVLALLGMLCTHSLLIADSSAHGQQPKPTAPSSLVLVRVLEDVQSGPLPNAEVLVASSGERRLTNERGETRIPWPASGRLTLRVRQIGFRFSTQDVVRPSAAAFEDTVVFRLRRVAYVLPAVRARAQTACEENTDSASVALSVAALEQLRLGAERYELFRRSYPFRIEIGRRTATARDGRMPTRAVETIERTESDKFLEPYKPGNVLKRQGRGFSVPVLSVSTLADSAFWAHHCFAAPLVESQNGARVIRLEFRPTRNVRYPDWTGVAFLDSATSVLRRLEFSLTGLRKNDLPRRLEGYTTFASPSPFVVVPDTTVAIWWRRDPPSGGDSITPDVGQMLYMRSITWRRAAPPRDQSSVISRQ